MSLKSDIKSLLETEFDLPFDVSKDHNQQDLAFIVSPAGSQNRLFNILLYFKNQIRLEMEFIPQKHAAQMVWNMGKANESKKAVFCAYAQQLTVKGAKSSIKINDYPQNTTEYSKWPDEWTRFSIKVAIRPIEFDSEDKPDYMGTLRIWLPIMMGMSLSLLNVENIEDESNDTVGLREGRKYDVTTSQYERNPVNRVLCLSKYGYKCQICGFDFEKEYGEIGKHFIHVHHIIPVSQMGDGYLVNPETDLIPVCPNCHAMLHRKNPPLSPSDLKELLHRKK